MLLRLPTLRTMLLFVALTFWFIVWLPGLVWFVNALTIGKLSWWLVEAVALLLYSIYATVEILQTLARRGSEEQTPTLELVPVPEQETVGDTVARLKRDGAVREV